jgi:hypothetical protein
MTVVPPFSTAAYIHRILRIVSSPPIPVGWCQYHTISAATPHQDRMFHLALSQMVMNNLERGTRHGEIKCDGFQYKHSNLYNMPSPRKSGNNRHAAIMQGLRREELLVVGLWVGSRIPAPSPSLGVGL